MINPVCRDNVIVSYIGKQSNKWMDNDGEKNTYYNYHKGKTEEISEKQYNTYMDSLYDEFN